MSTPSTATEDKPANISYKQLQPWVICLTASLFFMYEFSQNTMFNALGAPLANEFHLNATQLGTLSALSLYGNVMFLPLAGILLDRFSTRSIILVNMSMCVMSTYVFSISDSYTLACVTRFITGSTGAFCLLSANLMASRWFPSNKLGLITGLIITSGFSGGMMAQSPLNHIVSTYGWRSAVTTVYSIGIIFTILMYFILQDKPKEASNDNISQSDEDNISVSESVKLALLSKHSWLCGLYTSLTNIFVMICGVLWGAPYLQKVHGLTSMQATDITGVIFIGGIIGFPVFGAMSDYLKSRKTPMISGAIASLSLVLVLALSSNLSFPVLMAIFFTIGFTTSSQGISYPSIIESTKPHMIATCSALASVIIQGGGAFFVHGFGVLVDFHSNPIEGISNLNEYTTAADFTFAFWMLPVAYAITIMLALSIKETYRSSNNS